MYVAIGAMTLGALASLWLARALANPIDQLSQQLGQIASSHDFSRRIERRDRAASSIRAAAADQ